MRKVPGNKRLKVRLTSSGKVIGSALFGGIGLLIPLYATANRDLTGLRFVGAILFAAGAILLVLEGVQRIRSDKQGGWLCALGVPLALASLLLGLLPSNGPAGEGEGLRLDLRPTAPSLFHLAFEREIALPRTDEGWDELRRRGAIDIGDSHFRLILANEGSRPVSILSAHLEVLGSEPMPHGTEAHAYSQGDEGLDRFVAFLPDGKRGSRAEVFTSDEPGFDREDLDTATPFFAGRYVLLEPGEVYPATLTVKADTPRTITYRLVAEGESANKRFVVRSSPFQVVGDYEDPYQERFRRYYMFGYDPSACTDTPDNDWIDSRVRRRSLACPFGLGYPYEIRPPSESEYPRGELRLNLELARGRQSVTVSGVEVGAAPAAMPVPGVVEPILKALGVWTSCTVFSPSTDYWTARWEAWNLDLSFASDGGATDCTPQSPAGLREIEISEPPGQIDTEFGPIVLGSPLVPKPIRRLAEPAEGAEYEPEFVVPGSSPCDPRQPDYSRYELWDDVQSGILAWKEDEVSGLVGPVRVTLPEVSC